MEGGLETHHQGDSFVVVFHGAGARGASGDRLAARPRGPRLARGRTCASAWDYTRARRRSAWMATSVLPMHQASRIGDAGHGGQVLVSATTAAIVEPDLPEDVGLRDLGGVRLPDLDRPERLFQLTAAGLAERFPPLVKRIIETTPAPGPPCSSEKPGLETLRAIAEDDLQLGNGLASSRSGGAPAWSRTAIAEMRRIAAAAGLDVLGARGGEFEQQFPFGVVRQLFEPAVGVPERREELLSGAAGLAAPLFDQSRLAGALGQSTDTSFATLHGLYWLTANLAARTPVLLAVDDALVEPAVSLRWLHVPGPPARGRSRVAAPGVAAGRADDGGPDARRARHRSDHDRDPAGRADRERRATAGRTLLGATEARVRRGHGRHGRQPVPASGSF